MKKVLITCICCVFCALATAQTKVDSLSNVEREHYKKMYALRSEFYKATDGSYVFVPAMKNYTMGDKCFKTGIGFVSAGAVLSFVGGILSACGVVQNNTPMTKAGYSFLGIGGTFVEISIPLLCFGDHIKRDASMTNSLVKDFLFLNGY